MLSHVLSPPHNQGDNNVIAVIPGYPRLSLVLSQTVSSLEDVTSRNLFSICSTVYFVIDLFVSSRLTYNSSRGRRTHAVFVFFVFFVFVWKGVCLLFLCVFLFFGLNLAISVGILVPNMLGIGEQGFQGRRIHFQPA